MCLWGNQWLQVGGMVISWATSGTSYPFALSHTYILFIALWIPDWNQFGICSGFSQPIRSRRKALCYRDQIWEMWTTKNNIASKRDLVWGLLKINGFSVPSGFFWFSKWTIASIRSCVIIKTSKWCSLSIFALLCERGTSVLFSAKYRIRISFLEVNRCAAVSTFFFLSRVVIQRCQIQSIFPLSWISQHFYWIE